MKKFCLLFSYVALFALVTSPVGAQLNPFAPPDVSAPITEGSPSGGLSAGTFVDRARAVAAPPASPQAARSEAAVSGAASPFVTGKDEFAPPPAGAPTAPIAPAAPGMPAAPATPAIKYVKVLAGERVKDAVNGAVLEDIHYESVPESMLKDHFYDDGTHGDQEAGDGLYTNITERSDVLGKDSNDLKLQLLALLRTTEETSPLDFFRLHVTTNEPISSIPNGITQEKLRDERLKEWNRKFVRPYRKSPDDPSSQFYPVYVPQPPRVPLNNPPMPPNFNPVEAERQRQAAQAGQAGTAVGAAAAAPGAAVDGAPVGNASSRYYDTRKMP